LKLVLGLCILSLPFTASATQLFTNGGFDLGTTGWLTATSNPSDPNDGFFVVPGAAGETPISGFATAGAFAGSNYAVSDGDDFGARAIYQSFVAPSAISIILSFEMFVNDELGLGSGFGSVDLMANGSDPITGTPIHTFYSADTATAGLNVPNPYLFESFDITSYVTAGTTYYIRFFSEDDLGNPADFGPIHVGVDSVSLDFTPATATPEPGMFWPLALVAGIALFRFRRLGFGQR